MRIFTRECGDSACSRSRWRGCLRWRRRKRGYLLENWSFRRRISACPPRRWGCFNVIRSRRFALGALVGVGDARGFAVDGDGQVLVEGIEEGVQLVERGGLVEGEAVAAFGAVDVEVQAAAAGGHDQGDAQKAAEQKDRLVDAEGRAEDGPVDQVENGPCAGDQ